MKEQAANWQATGALREAYFGNRDRARQEAAAALAITSTRNVQPQAALAFAWAGDATRAQAVAADLAKRYPKNILISSYFVPTIRAVVELNRGNAAGALDLLKETIPYEAQYCMDAAYARGQAYLASHQGTAAAAEFQEMLDHRGLMNLCPQMSLAHLGMARAPHIRILRPLERRRLRHPHPPRRQIRIRQTAVTLMGGHDFSRANQ